jgi:threonine synthase
MRYPSTRGAAAAVPLSEAVRNGIAPDGGLYIPERMPHFEPGDFADCDSLQSIAARFLRPFFAGDAFEDAVDEIVADAFNFPAPLKAVPRSAPPFSVLELFHGPTAAFKDFGARFLAAAMQRMPQPDPRLLTILVATSGDTGGAVAAAFHRRPWVRVVVLYPRGLVSPLQEQQLTCWGDNVRSVSVSGTFDDCQRLVKEAFADSLLKQALRLSSANSINIGRLLPQAVYYAAASLAVWRVHRERLSFVVPSGNLGNVMACLWARASGLPIGAVKLAHNANRTVPDFLASGEWRPRPSQATLASAMDVGNPSNMERLRALHPDWHRLAAEVTAEAITDDEIRARIRADYQAYGEVWCPHTATAAEVHARLPVRERERPWAIVATAHPAKFSEIVTPLIGRAVEVPPALAALFELPSHRDELVPQLPALRQYLLGTA